MSAERMQVVELLFLELVGMDAAAREAVLTERCAGDASLADEVRALLGHHDGAEEFLDPQELRRIAAEASAAEPALPAGTRVGDYTVLGLLGQGGMGIVYVAQQEKPRRTVALKLIRASMIASSALRRFEHEAEVLGLLQHPGIAQIFEAGWAQLGQGSRPYIVMELVDGLPLAKYASGHKLSLRQRLELMARVCDAVHHAHQRGVIHRDLKPGNILVDKSGQPKVLDFGVSRGMDSGDRITELQTSAGQIIGTIAYMSPEQASGDADQVDVRADVYALGVVLYELLTNKLPFDIASRPMHEAARIIHDEEPRKLGHLGREFRGDLEVIVAKAMDKDRLRRYQSAAQLGDDIRRHLEGSPIAAKQDSAIYVAKKLLRRHRLAAGVAGLFALGVVWFAVYAWRQAGVQTRLAADERAARVEADQARKEIGLKAQELRENLYVSAIGYAQAAFAARDADRMRRVLDSCPPNQRGWEWRYLKRISDASDRSAILPEQGLSIAGACENATRIVTWSGDHPVRVLDARSGEEQMHFESGGPVAWAVISPDGRVCVWATPDRVVHAGDCSTGRVRVALQQSEVFPMPVCVCRQGDAALIRATVKDGDERAVLVDLVSGGVKRDLGAPMGYAGSFSPDGKLLALPLTDGRVRVCDLGPDPGADRYFAVHDGTVWSVRFSHDGHRLATGGHDGLLGVIDLDSSSVRTYPVSSNKVISLAWSPDDSMIAASGTEPVISVVQIETMRLLSTLLGHDARVDTIAWGRDGLVSSARDRTIRWWHDPLRRATESLALSGSGISLRFDPRGGVVYVAVDRGHILAMNPKTMETIYEFPVVDEDVLVLVVSPDGGLLVACCDGGRVMVFDTSARKIVAEFRSPEGRALGGAFDPTGSQFVLAGDWKSATVWDPRTGKLLREMPPGPSIANSVAWSPDGRLIAAGHMGDVVRLYDAVSGDVLAEMHGHQGFVSQMLFTAKSQTLVGGDDFGVITQWDVNTGAMVRKMEGHQHGVYALGLSPDGTRLVSGGWDNTVRVWDASDGHELLTLRGHLSGVYSAQFSPDGLDIMSVSSDKTLRMWSTRDNAGIR